MNRRIIRPLIVFAVVCIAVALLLDLLFFRMFGVNAQSDWRSQLVLLFIGAVLSALITVFLVPEAVRRVFSPESDSLQPGRFDYTARMVDTGARRLSGSILDENGNVLSEEETQINYQELVEALQMRSEQNRNKS